MKRMRVLALLCLVVLILLTMQGYAEGQYEYIEPEYKTTGLLAMFYDFSSEEYMEYVGGRDNDFGRVSNVAGEIKGYPIGRMASFEIDWSDLDLTDRHLASIMLSSVWDVDDYTQWLIDDILADLDSSRVWLMGSETYGWHLDDSIPARVEEFYLFRVESSQNTYAFIIACQYEMNGGESTTIKLLEDRS